ncbi:helix-turn-helix domain-containing protein [Nocardioides sp. GXQ0305]|uniref:helix-turn-helix domain-containing protein n=1 Tax=Nocardioides sp. GXQ0305 TaxID=3423912 RepID=UPI003D7C7A58
MPPLTSPTRRSRLPDLVRRARRLTGLSQRGLADRLGISHSTVARWETGVTSPDLATFERLAGLAGLRLVAVDAEGEVVEPMRADAARDRAGRRYPSHLDPHAREWRVPPGVHMTGEWAEAWRRAAEEQRPRVRFEHAAWRDLLRGLLGVPPDHPTRAALVAEVRAWLGETSHDEPEAPD